MRTCSQPNCTKPHRAKGLCSTHYNHAYQPQRHAARPTQCVVCGTGVMRPYRSDRMPTCSVVCRTLLSFGACSENSSYEWESDAMQRARKAGARVVERVERRAVFDRDSWVCYLCHTSLDPQADVFDPLSATVDHVVPLSLAGEHTMANVRCACLGCNSRKQDHEAA